MKQVARSETRTGVVVARGKVRASESETLCGWTVSIAELWWRRCGMEECSCASAPGAAQLGVVGYGSDGDEMATEVPE